MKICSVHDEKVHFTDSEIRKGFALIPVPPGFPNCQLFFLSARRIPHDKDLQKDIKHNSFETQGGSLK